MRQAMKSEAMRVQRVTANAIPTSLASSNAQFKSREKRSRFADDQRRHSSERCSAGTGEVGRRERDYVGDRGEAKGCRV